MTTEQAIKSLENIIEYWDCRPTEQKVAELAITALHEKQEREKTLARLEAEVVASVGSGGKWEVIGMRPAGASKTHYCSICENHGSSDMRFCPSCGARMEAED